MPANSDEVYPVAPPSITIDNPKSHKAALPYPSMSMFAWRRDKLNDEIETGLEHVSYTFDVPVYDRRIVTVEIR